MNVKQIITEYLKGHGYDGLYSPDYDCGCEPSDDFPCDVCNENCVPARKRKATAEDIDEENGSDFEIGDDIFVPVEEEGK